ncbi:hypothetical protein [Streptomyces boluensis]|uniref:Uncharacterized protein n=1 Tax=Streptomyces boluensis TaxID=1775135 RepID=A0A964UUC5_9ACTN|nr:hypothetical protein [Streptomyces boluensis]NBE55579.1 hypothetical protein [Streptomyces boluensis]
MRRAGGPVVVAADGPVTEESLRQCADVLCCGAEFGSAADAERAGRQVLACYPGCVLVVVPCSGERCLAVARTGAVGHILPRSAAAGPADLWALAVEWYGRLVAGAWAGDRYPVSGVADRRPVSGAVERRPVSGVAERP